MEDFFDRLQAIVGISKYSNSEVITPLNIVKDMVDLLPADVFKPEVKFLDPAVKSGRFLAEIYRRLMDSPLLSHMNEKSRRRHILENQLYGLATSATAATIVRKQLYDDPTIAGNIVYIDRYLTLMADKGTDFRKLIEKEFGQMKFDVVIGNPPYQESTGGGGNGKQASSVYQRFIAAAMRISDITCMITKNNWMSSDTVGDVRKEMLNNGLVYVKNYPNPTEVFNGVSVAVSIFLVNKSAEKNNTHYVEVVDGQTVSDFWGDFRDMVCIPSAVEQYQIIQKTRSKDTFDKLVVGKMVFGIASNGRMGASGKEAFIDESNQKTDYYNTPLVYLVNGDILCKYVCESDIPKNVELLKHHKIVCGQQLNKNGNVITNIRGLPNGCACTQSFTVLYADVDKSKAYCVYKYVKTKFFRLLTYCAIDTVSLTTATRFKLVPVQDFTSNSDIDWSQSVADIDKQLYKKYGLSPEEIEYIENTIKPME